MKLKIQAVTTKAKPIKIAKIIELLACGCVLVNVLAAFPAAVTRSVKASDVEDDAFELTFETNSLAKSGNTRPTKATIRPTTVIIIFGQRPINFFLSPTIAKIPAIKPKTAGSGAKNSV